MKTTTHDLSDFAIKALDQMLGDDHFLAKTAFLGFTPEQMNEQHGQSGKTRSEILKGYEGHAALCAAAISWIKERR